MHPRGRLHFADGRTSSRRVDQVAAIPKITHTIFLSDFEVNLGLAITVAMDLAEGMLTVLN